MEVKPSELINADVTVIINKDGMIINGTNGVLSGKGATLGSCVLGRMELGN